MMLPFLEWTPLDFFMLLLFLTKLMAYTLESMYTKTNCLRPEFRQDILGIVFDTLHLALGSHNDFAVYQICLVA